MIRNDRRIRKMALEKGKCQARPGITIPKI